MRPFKEGQRRQRPGLLFFKGIKIPTSFVSLSLKLVSVGREAVKQCAVRRRRHADGAQVLGNRLAFTQAAESVSFGIGRGSNMFWHNVAV